MVDYLIDKGGLALADRIERSADLNVPALCDAEMISGLRRATRRREISRDRARLALDHYLALPLIRHQNVGLLGRALELETFSTYDAIYVALAERLEAALLTTDQRLARAVLETRGLRVRLA